MSFNILLGIQAKSMICISAKSTTQMEDQRFCPIWFEMEELLCQFVDQSIWIIHSKSQGIHIGAEVFAVLSHSRSSHEDLRLSLGLKEPQLLQEISQQISKSSSTRSEPMQGRLDDKQVSFQVSKCLNSLDACLYMCLNLYMCIFNVCSPSFQPIPFCQK